MIDRSTALTIADAAIAATGADDLELSLRSASSATTRFANSAITQNIASRSDSLSVTAYFGKRKGSASTNMVDEEAVRGCVRRAEEIARLSPEDPEVLPSLGPQSYASFPHYYETSAAFGPEARAQAARSMVEIASAAGASLAGTIERTSGSYTMASKKGMRACAVGTELRASCTADAGNDGTGWASDGHRDVSRIDFEGLARRAVDKAKASANPGPIDAGDWTVLLEPAAVIGLLNYLIWFWDARDTYAGTTFLSGKIGERLMGENIFLDTRPSDPALLGAPFDWDGLPAFEGPWVEAGRIVRFFHDRFTAQKHGVAPTGWPIGLVMRGGEHSPEELIKSTERAILVSRFWYIRSVDPMKLLLTGMTRDGTFLVEEGKIVRAVKNLRFNESTLGALSRIDAMTPSLPSSGGGQAKMSIPMVRVRDFHFDSATLF